MTWDTSRDTIGQSRTWIIGRILGGIYFLTVGLIFLGVGIVVAAVYAVLEAIWALILNRPLNMGRAWAYALMMHGLKLGKYPLGAGSWPGFLPSRADGLR